MVWPVFVVEVVKGACFLQQAHGGKDEPWSSTRHPSEAASPEPRWVWRHQAAGTCPRSQRHEKAAHACQEHSPVHHSGHVLQASS